MTSLERVNPVCHWCHSLNSLKGGDLGDYLGDLYRVFQEDTRSLDYGSYQRMSSSGLQLF